MRLLVPSRYPGIEGTQGVVSILSEYPGVRFKLEVESTGDALSFIPNDLLRRMVCHVLLESLPREAIDETWDSLVEAWRWHNRPRLLAGSQSRDVPQRVFKNTLQPVWEEPFSLAEE